MKDSYHIPLIEDLLDELRNAKVFSKIDLMAEWCTKFWWGSAGDKQGMHWKTWDDLCKPKEEGGLGFRKFTLFNQALLAKQVWRLILQPDSLVAQVFKARYFCSCNIMKAGIGSNPSFVWRFICWGRDLLTKGLRWLVVNGKDIEAEGRDWFRQ